MYVATFIIISRASFMSPLFIYPEILGYICSQFKSTPCYQVSFHISRVLTLKQTIKVFKPHVRTHQVVIIVIIVILTLCYFIMSKATLIIFYHTSILTLHISLISHAFLIATSVSLHSLECISFIIEVKILVLIKWSCRSPRLC